MHAKAEGPLKKLVFFLVVFVVVIVVGTWLEPFAAEYEVKTAAKIACNEQMQALKFKTPGRGWETKFLQAARRAGVQLDNDQFDFQPGNLNDRQEITCRFIIAWRSVTPIILVGDILALPPMTLLHRLDYVHAVKRNF